jgi:hypothetical protein
MHVILPEDAATAQDHRDHDPERDERGDEERRRIHHDHPDVGRWPAGTLAWQVERSKA